ncbi:hypothetical protein ALE3EI_2209 [Constantimarinum furrinae]|uniref:Uncharacterized protein n=1 Tax=Constantimarinum furrinae TaxID=2562285 RepID=A0A7G8PWN8_9FLAO|nr:hypothetical protein ALE3EI_2209 [Constantimarinum furrinae]
MIVNSSFRILINFDVKLGREAGEMCQKIVKEVSTVVKIKLIIGSLQELWANQVFIR